MWGADGVESFGGGSAGAKVAAASKDGEMAIKKFRLASGLQAELWAAEPLTANIVAFNFDDQGKCYVVETFRHSDGVTDIRSHMDWLDEELASQSVEERVAIMRRHEGARITNYTRMSDRVRKVWDSSGSGHADRATIFSDGYNAIPDGLASGVLAWRGSVYFADIPHLWRLPVVILEPPEVGAFTLPTSPTSGGSRITTGMESRKNATRSSRGSGCGWGSWGTISTG